MCGLELFQLSTGLKHQGTSGKKMMSQLRRACFTVGHSVGGQLIPTGLLVLVRDQDGDTTLCLGCSGALLRTQLEMRGW